MEPVAVFGGFLAAAVRVATPLLLAATGETVVQRSGVMNLGLEGMMLAGALAATLGASASGPWTGVVLGVLAGVVLAAAFALVTIGARADQVIAGTALTLGAVGLTGTVYRQAYGAAGAGLDLPTLVPIAIPGLSSVPVLGPAFFLQPAPTYLGRRRRADRLVRALPHSRRPRACGPPASPRPSRAPQASARGWCAASRPSSAGRSPASRGRR